MLRVVELVAIPARRRWPVIDDVDRISPGR
jgi:hypothetical protein